MHVFYVLPYVGCDCQLIVKENYDDDDEVYLHAKFSRDISIHD